MTGAEENQVISSLLIESYTKVVGDDGLERGTMKWTFEREAGETMTMGMFVSERDAKSDFAPGGCLFHFSNQRHSPQALHGEDGGEGDVHRRGRGDQGGTDVRAD